MNTNMPIEREKLPDQLINSLRGKEYERKMATVWERFFQLIKIPYPKTEAYPAGDAAKVIEYFREYATSNGFSIKTDSCQNVCIQVPATPGYEQNQEIVVQGHHDAVFVGEPDPRIHGIKPMISQDQKWIKGDGTNLIADNRLGIAMALTAVEDLARSGKPHGPLKLLFTAGEEIGLIGTTYLGASKSEFLNGKQILINVDSSAGPEWITIGCASGSRDEITLPIEYESIGNKKLVKFAFTGFPGGHSGIDIGKARPSSIKLFNDLFFKLQREFPEIGLVTIKAGEADNAIPTSAEFILAVHDTEENKILEFMKNYFTDIRERVNKIDISEDFRNSWGNLSIQPIALTSEEQQIQQQLNRESTKLLILSIHKYPQGLHKAGKEILSSTNLGLVRLQENNIVLTTMTRGKTTEYRDELRNILKKIFTKLGLSLEEKFSYPHWQPQPERPLVKQTKQLAERLLGKEIKTKVSLGGLEPGIFERDFPGLEAISISAAKIENEHSLAEQAEISSATMGYLLLETLITAFSHPEK